ncbi:MAG TPA: amidohydrolase family protein [Thermoanaerobaculia bacterium]|nr:amidohydrolase family protein [Thermoanaerobaculia bacterium]
MRTYTLLPLLSVLLAAPASPGGQPDPAAAAPGGLRYTFLLSGKAAGTETVEHRPDGFWEAHFVFNDRGRGPDETMRWTLGPGGVPVALEVTGHDYLKNPVAERFTLTNGKASWKNSAENAETPAPSPALYIPLEGAPEIAGVLARALLASPGGRLKLLPVGEASAERLGTVEVKAGGRSRTVGEVVITGLGFAPSALWLDADGTFFAAADGWSTTVREGWEDVIPQLLAAQQAADEKREAALAARLAHRPAKGLALTHARLFDSASGESRPGTTVVVVGDTIQAVGPDGSLAIPAEAEIVDAKGKALLPGLWDLHTHLSSNDGLLNLAAGVTTVRDMANDVDQLTALKERWDSGRAIGPRVVRAGFMDSPGPYAGPSKVLVSTQAEAEAWVERYQKLGYEQIKIYSSMDPKLVPAIVAKAHGLGLRVSGHIPAFMTAEQAVREGFDEIQHVNFLFLNFLPVPDTRTPARFTEVAQHAVELDLSSEKVRYFFQLLKERNVAVDPTVNVFEDMFLSRPGQVTPSLAAVADRLPPQVRRGAMAGVGLPVPPGMDGRYRASEKALLAMVKALYDNGITIEAGTDALGGFTLHHELELYVEAGLPAPKVLQIATSGAARVTRHEDRGVIAPGKLADLILVDGDPAARIADIRRVVLTVKGGTMYDAGELYRALGVKPAV